MPTPKYIDRPDSSATDEFKRSLNNMVNTMLERQRSDQEFELELRKDRQKYQRGLWAEERARRERLDAEERADERYERRREDAKEDSEAARDEQRKFSEQSYQRKRLNAAIEAYISVGATSDDIEKVVFAETDQKDTSLSSLKKGKEDKVDEVIGALTAATFSKRKTDGKALKLEEEIEGYEDGLSVFGVPREDFEQKEGESRVQYKDRLLALQGPSETDYRIGIEDAKATRKLQRDAEMLQIPEAEYMKKDGDGKLTILKSDGEIFAAIKKYNKEATRADFTETGNFTTLQDLSAKLRAMEKAGVTLAPGTAALLKDTESNLGDSEKMAELQDNVLTQWVGWSRAKTDSRLEALDQKIDKRLTLNGQVKYTLENSLKQQGSRNRMYKDGVLNKKQKAHLDAAAKQGKGRLETAIAQMVSSDLNSTWMQEGTAERAREWMNAEVKRLTGTTTDEELANHATFRNDNQLVRLLEEQSILERARETLLNTPWKPGGAGVTLRTWDRRYGGEGTSLPGGGEAQKGGSLPKGATWGLEPDTTAMIGDMTPQQQLTDAEAYIDTLKKKEVVVAAKLKKASSGRQNSKAKQDALRAARKDKEDVARGLAFANSRVTQLKAAIAAQPKPGESVPTTPVVPEPTSAPAPTSVPSLPLVQPTDPAAPLTPAATQGPPQPFSAGEYASPLEREAALRSQEALRVGTGVSGQLQGSSLTPEEEEFMLRMSNLPQPPAAPEALPETAINEALGPPADDTEKLVSLFIKSNETEKEALASAEGIMDVLEGRSAPPSGVTIPQLQAVLEEARRIWAEGTTEGFGVPVPATPVPEPGLPIVRPDPMSAPAVPVLPSGVPQGALPAPQPQSVPMPTLPQQSIPVPMAPQSYAPAAVAPTSVPALPALQDYIPAQAIDPQLGLPAAAPAMMDPRLVGGSLPLSLRGPEGRLPQLIEPQPTGVPMPAAPIPSAPMPAGLPGPRAMPIEPAVAPPYAAMSSIPTPMVARALTPAESLGRPGVPLLSAPEPSLDYRAEGVIPQAEEPMEGPKGDLAQPAPDDLEIEGDHSRVTALLMKKEEGLSADEAQEGAAQIMEMVMRVKAGQAPVEGLGRQLTEEYTKKLMLLIKEAREMPIEDVKMLLQRRYTPEIPPLPGLPGANPTPPSLPSLPGLNPANPSPPPGLPPLP